MFFFHGQGGIQKCQYIPFALRHYGKLGDIAAEFLHAAEIMYDFFFWWCFCKIMAGADYSDAGLVGSGYNGSHGFVPPGELHIDQINGAAFNGVKVGSHIIFGGDMDGSAFCIGADGEKKRNVSQGIVNAGKCGV